MGSRECALAVSHLKELHGLTNFPISQSAAMNRLAVILPKEKKRKEIKSAKVPGHNKSTAKESLRTEQNCTIQDSTTVD